MKRVWMVLYRISNRVAEDTSVTRLPDSLWHPIMRVTHYFSRRAGR